MAVLLSSELSSSHAHQGYLLPSHQELPFLYTKYIGLLSIPLHRTVLPHDSFYNHPSFRSLSQASGPQISTLLTHICIAPASYYCVIWQMACHSITCGVLLSTPTFLESPSVYYSRLM